LDVILSPLLWREKKGKASTRARGEKNLNSHGQVAGGGIQGILWTFGKLLKEKKKKRS